MRRGAEAAIPYFALPVQKASFNRKLSQSRRLAVTEFDLKEFRELKAATGATINDVALAIVGAAVGAYLRERGEPTQRRKLRILAPVNVRRPDQSGRLGNHISMLLVEVPLWEMSPVERLAMASRRMSWLKTEHASDGVEMIAEELLSLPTPILKAVTALGSPPNTVANMVCTNVPGPAMPLYTVGHRMVAHYPIAPLGWQMGLSCAVTSYDGKITFTLVCDPQAVTHVDRLRDLLVEAYAEMRDAVLSAGEAEEIFEEIEAAIEAGEIAAMEGV
jgi:WS/DGAT/MGAT family acyltransferase